MSTNDIAFLYNLPPSYFSNKKATLPSYSVYQNTYEKDFLRYLFYLCVMGAEGEYPTGEFDSSKIFVLDPNNPFPCVIKKVLIGEAPPSIYSKYFYNPNGIWPNGSPWKSEVSKALFGNRIFRSKIDFLKACAQSGFLLLDLFPYAIKYTGRASKKYQNACISAFLGMNPFNIMYTLHLLSPFICKTLAIGFGLTDLGETILNDVNCISDFTNWATNNGVILKPSGVINLPRTNILPGQSKYLRVCHLKLRNNYGPSATLQIQAGF